MFSFLRRFTVFFGYLSEGDFLHPKGSPGSKADRFAVWRCQTYLVLVAFSGLVLRKPKRKQVWDLQGHLSTAKMGGQKAARRGAVVIWVN